MLRLIALTLSVAVAAAPAAAAENNRLDRNKIICKTQGELGTRLSRTKVCKTRAQWDLDSRENQKRLREAESNRQQQ